VVSYPLCIWIHCHVLSKQCANDRLVSGGRNGKIAIWDPTRTPAENPILRLDGHGNYYNVYQLRYSPDGTRIVSGSYDYTVRLWDAVNGGPEIAIFIGHLAGINSVSYSPDGQRVVSCSNDGTVRLWDTSDAALSDGGTLETTYSIAVIDIAPQDSNIGCDKVEYSTDGSMIATTDDEDIIKIWDVELLEKNKVYNALISSLFDDGGVDEIFFRPNGKAIAYDSGPIVKLWVFEPPTVLPTKVPTKSPIISPTKSPVSPPVSQSSNNDNDFMNKGLRSSSSTNRNSVLGVGAIAGVIIGSVAMTCTLLFIYVVHKKKRNSHVLS